jgi:hypothetical protein
MDATGGRLGSHGKKRNLFVAQNMHLGMSRCAQSAILASAELAKHRRICQRSGPLDPHTERTCLHFQRERSRAAAVWRGVTTAEA